MIIPSKHASNVFGEFDKNIKKIEKQFRVTIVSRGDGLHIVGEEGPAKKAEDIISALLTMSENGEVIDDQKVNYLLDMEKEKRSNEIVHLDDEIICHTMSGKPIKPKTIGQKDYVESMKDCMITFGIGPAGTGKTYLAMAMAITAFKNEEVERIILTRPAIEAGEKLGFLPGDLQSKVDPYLRPLYDALYQIMGGEAFAKNMEKGLIEVAPLAYMRGRTLDNAYIILDEAQNTTPAQMKMFLTRLGFGSKAVITGDITQKDLPAGQKSGLDDALHILRNIEEIAVCQLTDKDVVRHPLVQRIVKAYDEYEKFNKEKKEKKRSFTPKRGPQNGGEA